GQRRYVESLSAYARQFLGQMEKPHYDVIRGLSPTISIEQKAASNNPRSTVGTITEIHDYLRVLFAAVGKQHCTICGRRVDKKRKHDIQVVVDRLVIKGGETDRRLIDSVETALREGKGVLHALTGLPQKGETHSMYSEHLSCPVDGISFPELAPHSFSFNNP